MITSVRLSEHFVLPSLEEIEQMERRRSQAIESLEISDHSVMCQRCSQDIPIVGKQNRPCNDMVVILQRRIKWMDTIPITITGIGMISNN
jgi:hypothetical protein